MSLVRSDVEFFALNSILLISPLVFLYVVATNKSGDGEEHLSSTIGAPQSLIPLSPNLVVFIKSVPL